MDRASVFKLKLGAFTRKLTCKEDSTVSVEPSFIIHKYGNTEEIF